MPLQRKTRWPSYYMVVLLLLVAVLISYIDRTNISVGAIAMQAQLGWSETQKGMVLSSFFIGYMLMMLASSALANRLGGKVVLGVAVVWWSAFTMLTPSAATISLTALIGARIGLGLGEAAVLRDLVCQLERAGIARQKFPERLELVEEMPRTAAGKIKKDILRKKIASTIVSGTG